MHANQDTTTASSMIAKAETILASRFQRTRPPNAKVAAFQTESGRQLAIERNLQGITIWTERLDRTMSEESNVEHYSASRTRHSNLQAHAPRLYTGNPATKWRLTELAGVEDLVRWYANA